MKHDGPCLPARIPEPEQCKPPQDVVAQIAMPPPRNHAADVAKMEALYVSLDDLPIHDWGILQQFKGELARRITDLRLRP